MTTRSARQCAGVAATLEKEVLPHLTNEVARGQVFSAIYVLSETALRLDVAFADLLADVGRQDALFAGIAGLAEAAGLRPPPARDRPQAPPPTQAAALSLRDAGDAHICVMLDWCWAAGAGGIDVREIHGLLRDEMRLRIDAECTLTPRPMFAQITGG